VSESLISYGGVTFPQVTPEVEAKVQWLIDQRHTRLFETAWWPGYELQKLAFRPPWPQAPVRVGEWHWPRGATRFSYAVLVCDDTTLAAVRAVAYVTPTTTTPAGTTTTSTGTTTSTTPGGAYPTKQVLRFSDGRGGVVQSPMWMLPPRPLFQTGTPSPGTTSSTTTTGTTAGGTGTTAAPDVGRQLYLCVFVDDRYWWPTKRATGVAGTTWAEVEASLKSALGIDRLSADSAHPDYGPPAGIFVQDGQNPAALFDALAYSTGRRVTVALDGCVHLASPYPLRTLDDLFASQPNWRRIGGGRFLFGTSPPPTDLPALVPESVTLAFPRQSQGGVELGGHYLVTVSLAELAIPNYAGVAGVPGASQRVNADIPAVWCPASPLNLAPSNAAALTALARRYATDWYAWQLSWYDVTAAGVAPLNSFGYADRIVWTHRKGECNTRVARDPYDDAVDRLNVGGGEAACVTTTPAPCPGRCLWSFLDGTWVLVFNGCTTSSTTSTTTTTGAGTTTSTSTTTGTTVCGMPDDLAGVAGSTSTTTTTTTTALPPCQCSEPTFCPPAADCNETVTNCVRGQSPPQPSCTTTTTGTGTTATTTTTTAAPPPGCTAGCDWLWIPGVGWVNKSNGCSQSCPCPTPTAPGGSECESAHTACAVTVVTTCQPACQGECRFVCLDNGVWAYVGGACSPSCSDSPGSCYCEAPPSPCGHCGGVTATPCLWHTTPPPRTTTPGGPTTTTTANPASCPGRCLWRWDGSAWQYESTTCPAGCNCFPPGPAGIGTPNCELIETPCYSGTTTTTTATTTSSTTTVTTTSCANYGGGPCLGTCTWRCSAGVCTISSGGCGPGCGCAPPMTTTDGFHVTNCVPCGTTVAPTSSTLFPTTTTVA
jgi:hypothetical protein